MKIDGDDNRQFRRLIIALVLIVAISFNISQFLRFVSDFEIDRRIRTALETLSNSLLQVFIIILAIAIAPVLRSRLLEILCLGGVVSFVEFVGLHFTYNSMQHASVGAKSMGFYASLAFTFLVMTYGFIRLIRKTGGPPRVYFILGILFALVFCGRLQVLLYWSHRLPWWRNDGWKMCFLLLAWMLGLGLMMMFLAYLLLKNEVSRNQVDEVPSIDS